MFKIYEGETVARAIVEGLEELKVSEDDVRIDVEDEGRKGFFGLGKRDAVIKLTVINPELKMYGSIDSLIAREQSPKTNEASSAYEKSSADAIVYAEEVGDERDNDDSRAGKEEHTAEEAASLTQGYIMQVIKDMNIDAESSMSVLQNEVTIELTSPMAAKLIGKRGNTLNALQEIAQQFFNTIYKSYGTIVVDVEGYRKKRRETLENLAVNMSKKALRSGQPIRLEPMPSSERKIMHNVLSREKEINTYSEGTEPRRYIVIEKK
ncbi:protein jag [Salinicoccus jeotgali]|uniref:RNA-binding protein KhpB n=1 Tax=Salinicoccus jeotgali TaxID=381634 RepID=A0ABP7ETM3_9STAP